MNKSFSTLQKKMSSSAQNAAITKTQQFMSKILNKKKIDAYFPFDPADYVKNPIALARIKAGITQTELAKRMKVTQAYTSKIEAKNIVTLKLLQKVKNALGSYRVKC